MDAHFRSFLREVVPVLIEHKMALLAMKPMGDAIILKRNTVIALSQPTSVVITAATV
jgi:hypothetical protein